ncbi:caspase family protein [Microcoleus sp. S13_C5]
MPLENTNSSEDLQSRRLEVAIPTSYATYVDRWAIVVGISKYKDKSLNLKYADRDAEELCKLLQTPSGGGFEADHIVKLVNEDATTANITRALRSFLKKPASEDIVLIYFASHGAPDIDRPENVYLLTHDTDPRDISGTALPMREVDLSLRDLLAERVIVIADTCHSAAIGAGIGRRSAENNSGVVNRYLQEVGISKPSLALLTSAEANEVSWEGEKWGGGHGVFTHYLLEGMRGAADYQPQNGIVTVWELFEYVREKVETATGNKQHPCIGSQPYDPNLPMAITAGISAHEHYEIGCQLYQLGLKLDDRSCFKSASNHLQEALRLSRITGKLFPEISLQLGLTWMAHGDLVKAIEEFEKATKADVPDAAYYLGIAYTKQSQPDGAIPALELFLTRQPDDDKAAWVSKLVSWLQLGIGKRHALLIGINYYSRKIEFKGGGTLRPLDACVNDIQILSDVLSNHYNFNITMLRDVEATYENILKAFHDLQNQVQFNDNVVIQFSGHELLGNLLAFDVQSDEEKKLTNIISIKKLHELVTSIPAAHKIIFIDAVISYAFAELVKLFKQTKDCTLFLAASPGQVPYEENIDARPYGFFSYTVAQQLKQASEETNQVDVFSKVRKIVEEKFPKQQPFLVGNYLNKKLFSTRLDYCADIFDLSWYKNYSALTSDNLKAGYEDAKKKLDVPFYRLHYNVGRAFLEKSAFQPAIAALEISLSQSKYSDSGILFELGTAQFKQGLYADSYKTFQHYITSANSTKTSVNSTAAITQFQELISQMVALQNPLFYTGYALLIGIKDYLSSDIQAVKGAINDVSLLKSILIDKYGFQAENIRVLCDQDATCQTILTEFKELAKKADEAPALFYFSGHGSWNHDNLTILGVDSRELDVFDIELNELSEIVSNRTTNLVTMIDASWSMSTQGGEYNSRSVPPDRRPHPSKREIIPVTYNTTKERTDKFLSNSSLKIGRLSIYANSIRHEIYEGALQVEANYPDDSQELIHGVLTYNFIKSLSEDKTGTRTYNQLIKSIPFEAQPFVVGTNLDDRLFENYVRCSLVNELLRKIKQEPVEQTISFLKRLIEQRNGFDPESHLNLGIAYYTLGEYDKSIASVEAALNQVSEQNSEQNSEQKRKAQAFPEAHYWLGRVLCESKLDPAYAVKELRLATQKDPKNATAHYFLGQALLAMVEQKILTEAEQAFQSYLEAGSPLGQEEEVQEFLRSCRASKTS